ncbi:hypothetical protein [Niveibacterium sp. SC-1]|uniref:capsular polysaccharide biosynthesis protein n=1 Tax=Niveibacterium sp. SC-1 TaxID=3135646 RepID=UPI00311D3D6E
MEQRLLAYGWFLQGTTSLDSLFDGAEVVRGRAARRRADLTGVLAWGRKPSARRAEAFAARRGLRVLRAEDGFLRSYGTGDLFPPLAVTVDEEGIYYDSTAPSALESLLNSDADVLAGLHEDVARAKALILSHQLSKYNHAPAFDPASLREGDVQRVLVIDQTAGDLAVSCGGAGPESFAQMLQAALDENPGATVYVKTHPEVTSGRKAGYLTGVRDDERVVVLRGFTNPLSLIAHMDRVYAVTSTMGFEALLAGKPVTCFGMPWYGGWGATDDRQVCARRTRRRSVDEIFAAAYFHYSRYVDPDTGGRGTIFDVIRWLVRQCELQARNQGRSIWVGMQRWKFSYVREMLSLHEGRAHLVANAAAAERLQPTAADRLCVWGAEVPDALRELAARTGCRLLRAEDGFLRSVGLGSNVVPPLSAVLDEQGLYFDPGRQSALESVLRDVSFDEAELEEARSVRKLIVEHGLSKYNVARRQTAQWPVRGRRVVLVPGQVENDASIRLGCAGISSNAELLATVREACPDAFIVYKPHPEVLSGRRKGAVDEALLARCADFVEKELSVVSCIEACDELHTLTSLAGFDALLRERRVVTYGMPFYAGWGLTEDRGPHRQASARRGVRRLSLDELVAGVLLRYPIYWDARFRGYASCRGTIHRLVAQREDLGRGGELGLLSVGWAARVGRRLRLLLDSWRTL